MKLEAHDLRSAVLKGISLTLEAGKGVAIVGPSGSGKTSLFRALADLDPNDGVVMLDGRARESFRPEHWRQRVCYVPAEPGWWLDTAGAHADAAARKIAATFSLDQGLMDQPVDHLSTGERQRLALAMGFARQPDVLLLDEPTSALDEDSRDRVETRIRQSLNDGTALLIASHDPAQIDRLGLKILHMADGRLDGGID